MQNKKENPAPASVREVPGQAGENVYTLAQLVQGYRSLGAPRELVSVALKLTGKKSFTLAQAREIVNKFRNKEV